MRLRDYQNLLETSIGLLKQLSMTVIQNNASVGRSHDVKVFGLVAFNNAISQLEKTNLFDKIIKNIRSLEYFNRVENDIVVRQNEYDNLNNYKQQLLTQIENLKNTIDNILLSENEDSINIKIPQSISTISDLKDFINDLDLIFHVYKEFGCKVEFNGVETGSAWISVVIGIGTIAKPCIEFLFKIAEKGLQLRNLKIDGDRKLLELEELKGRIAAQEYENIINARKEKDEEEYNAIKIKMAKEALKILKSQRENLSNENEIMEKIKISLEKLGELMDKGMEIVPALNAPDEIKTLSTNFNEKLEEHKKIMIGLNTQKLIEKKDKEETQEQKTDEENINDK